MKVVKYPCQTHSFIDLNELMEVCISFLLKTKIFKNLCRFLFQAVRLVLPEVAATAVRVVPLPVAAATAAEVQAQLAAVVMAAAASVEEALEALAVLEEVLGALAVVAVVAATAEEARVPLAAVVMAPVLVDTEENKQRKKITYFPDELNVPNLGQIY